MPSLPDTHFLVFDVSQSRFALPVSSVREVLPMVALAQVEATPPFVVGYLDLFSEEAPLPVVRLDTLLGLPVDTTLPGLHTPLVVCRQGENTASIALIARRLEGVIRASPAPLALESRATATFNGCVTGVFDSGEDGAALVLSLPHLLLEEEVARLHHFGRLAAQRREAVRDTDSSSAIASSTAP